MKQSTDPSHVLPIDTQSILRESIAPFLTRANDQRTVETDPCDSEGTDRPTDMTSAVLSRTTECRPIRDHMSGSILEDHSDLPVIQVPGRATEEVVSEAISSGANDYFQSDEYV